MTTKAEIIADLAKTHQRRMYELARQHQQQVEVEMNRYQKALQAIVAEDMPAPEPAP